MTFLSIRNIGILLLFSLTALTLSSCTTTSVLQSGERRYVIIPGVGVSECMVGSDEAKFQQEFGGTKDGYYWIAKDRGVDARTSNGTIANMFFYFYSLTHKPFNAETREGIGRDSTIDDVIRTYGRPDQIHESVVSQFGEMPGAREKSLNFDSTGIVFTFWDGRLADIRTFLPKR